LIEGLGQHGTELFRSHPPTLGAQILDVGCGFGDTSVTLGNLVGPEGRVVAVDCAPNFVEAALARAKEHKVTNVECVIADVQQDDLGGPFDAAYSRFGTMFFLSPVVALRNIRRALKPGGVLAMSVWRKRQDNPCFYTAQQTVERFIKEEDKATDQVTCGPGPFSMAGADMVSDQLMAAGFEDIHFQRFDAPMCIGKDIEEALSFARDLGPAGEAIRLADGKAAEEKQKIEDALRESFAPYIQDDGVWATSSTWLITATRSDAASAAG
jgi:ubiquinone/menaquinone biosynthesis C-methylase UbiE